MKTVVRTVLIEETYYVSNSESDPVGVVKNGNADLVICEVKYEEYREV